MSDYTPGPWELVEPVIQEAERYVLPAERYNKCWWVGTGRPGTAIALVGGTDDNQEPNAHLIAAAPELLEIRP